jgi:drug/metabolite transporter (DMT)-like permease
VSGSQNMILAVTCFAVVHASVKYLGHIPFFEIVFFRALISLVMCSYSLYRLKIPFLGSNKKILLARGLAGTIGLVLYFYTLQVLPLATAVTLQYLSPLFTILLSQWLLREVVRPIQWLLFAVAFFGVFVIQGGFDGELNWSVVAGLLGALASGFAYNFVRMLKGKEHELVIVLYFPFVTVPLMLPFVVTYWQQPEGFDWLVLLTIGVFTQLAQVSMTRALQMEPVAKVSVYNYLGVIYSILVGWWLFEEALTMHSVVGIVLICLSLLWSSRIRFKTQSF